MRFLLVLVCAALLAGCSSTRVGVNVGASSSGAPPAGTTVTSSRAGLHVEASRGAALAIMIIALLASTTAEDWDRPLPDPRALVPGNTPPAPALAPERPVNEQDCSAAIADSGANLKCR